MQQILKYIQPGTLGFDRAKLNILIPVIVTMLMLGGSYHSMSQCPDGVKDSFEIVVNENNNSDQVSITAQMTINIGIDLSSVSVQLYNYAVNKYYWDDENALINTVSLRKYNNSLEFNNVPAGDYAIIIKQSGCKDEFLGFGYSGFPYAGIQID